MTVFLVHVQKACENKQKNDLAAKFKETKIHTG